MKVMRKFCLSIFILLVLFIRLQADSVVFAQAQPPAANPPATQNTDNLIICGGCPSDLNKVYQDRQTGERCVPDYATFQQNPTVNHLWVEDASITAQGKADDRARQFIYWVVTNGSIDNHPVLYKIWGTTRNVAYFLVILVAALMGAAMIINQRSNFSSRIKIWPAIMKILLILLYISFSASLVITIIQLSEIMMKFFIENLGGKDLFNIYFAGISQEKNYLDFVGCRDLNIRVQESLSAEMFILKITNITYYVMAGMLILRKILLWFLLFVSPFLALLMPFVFIRNIGWIWIGVFFQWVFYGPLFALFLGSMASIWKAGIPFLFDFSRTGTTAGYIYPTVTNILYGGASQRLSVLNSANYVDTFAEYVIMLIMQWAVIFFPWWLLRIFRDYCCDGINAMKNILMSMYDQSRNPPSTPPGPTPTPSTIGTSLKIPRDVEIPMKIKLETTEEIKRAKTEDITRSLSISTSHLTDIANFETNKQTNETVRKNINYLQNPMQATTTSERQKYMNIKTELYSRAMKNDQVARTVLSSISTSRVEQQQRRDNILKSMPQMVPVIHVVSIRTNVPQEIIRAVTNSLTTDTDIVNDIAKKTQLQTTQVKTVLSSLNQNIDQTPAQAIQKIAEASGAKKEQVATILKTFIESVKADKKVTQSIAEKEKIKVEQVEKIVEAQIPMVAEPEKNIEQTVSIPPTVSIEEYEQVKKMWQHQYETGEVPTTENISSREQWVNQDIVFITNTLNKLLSPVEEMKQQGLDDVGYILPIFLINNMKGEELMVYLKAKLEAAKTVQEDKQKEKEIEAKLKSKTEEELVNVANPKEEHAEKTMTMEEQMDVPEEKKPEQPAPENPAKNTTVK